MSAAIGQVLSLGVGASLSPIPIVGVVLMLGTPQALRERMSANNGAIMAVICPVSAAKLIGDGITGFSA